MPSSVINDDDDDVGGGESRGGKEEEEEEADDVLSDEAVAAQRELQQALISVKRRRIEVGQAASERDRASAAKHAAAKRVEDIASDINLLKALHKEAAAEWTAASNQESAAVRRHESAYRLLQADLDACDQARVKHEDALLPPSP